MVNKDDTFFERDFFAVSLRSQDHICLSVYSIVQKVVTHLLK